MPYATPRRHPSVTLALLKGSWTLRRGLAPFYYVFSLWGLGALVHTISSGAVQTTVAVELLLGVVLWWMLERGKKGKRVQLYVWLLYLCTAVWLAVAAGVGAAPPMPGFLLTGFLPFAVPWWIYYRIRGVSKVAKQGDELRIWEELVACPGGALPGSFLMDVKHNEDGWTATVVLPGGFKDSEEAMAARKRIASAYASAYGVQQAISFSSVTLEPTEDDRADLLKLSVFKSNPTEETMLYDPEKHFELVEGCVPVMRFPDRTMGYARIFKEHSGAFHVIIAGSTGSGKSRVTDLFLTQSNLTGLVHTWFADPQGGNSSGAWAGKKGKAKFIARDMDEIREMLYAAQRVMMARSGANSQMTWTNEEGEEEMGVDWFDPTPERPILQLVIEEAYNILADKELLVIVLNLARMARKCGIQLVLIVQWPGLDQLGGSNALRDQLKNGTIICMRVNDSEAGDLLLPAHIKQGAHPAKMPKRFSNGDTTEGLGVLDSSAPNSSRGVYGRTILLENDKRQSTSPRWARVASQYSPELEPEAAEAAGEYFQYFRRHGEWPSRDDGPSVSMTKPSNPTPPDPRTRILDFLADPEVVATKSVNGAVQLNLIAVGVGLEKPNALYHLNKLQEEGKVTSHGNGRWSLVVAGVLV